MRSANPQGSAAMRVELPRDTTRAYVRAYVRAYHRLQTLPGSAQGRDTDGSQSSGFQIASDGLARVLRSASTKKRDCALKVPWMRQETIGRVHGRA